MITKSSRRTIGIAFAAILFLIVILSLAFQSLSIKPIDKSISNQEGSKPGNDTSSRKFDHMTNLQISEKISFLQDRQNGLNKLVNLIKTARVDDAKAKFKDSFKFTYEQDEKFRIYSGEDVYQRVMSGQHTPQDVAKISGVLAALSTEITSQIIELSNEKLDRSLGNR